MIFKLILESGDATSPFFHFGVKIPTFFIHGIKNQISWLQKTWKTTLKCKSDDATSPHFFRVKIQTFFNHGIKDQI